jgi:hypothetical protein
MQVSRPPNAIQRTPPLQNITIMGSRSFSGMMESMGDMAVVISFPWYLAKSSQVFILLAFNE